MSFKSNLTNEELKKRFNNPFALVNYAISLAKGRIAKGEEFHSNAATEILDTIESGEDLLEESEENEDESAEEIEESVPS